jgi:hypothetical protein
VDVATGGLVLIVISDKERPTEERPMDRPTRTRAIALTLAATALLATVGTRPSAAAPSPGFYATPTELSQLKPGAVIRTEPETSFLPTLDGFSKAYRVLYRSTGQLGKPVAVSGMVFVPKGRAPKGGWPVVAWDHGTSGVGDQCNPSRWPDMYDGGQWDLYADQIDGLLKQGYVVTASDYEGLGTDGLHTYLLTDALGRATIDAVRAARAIVPAASARWAAIGHSEGGQAAIGAGELVSTYGKGLTYVGAVGYAPSQHLEDGVTAIASDKFSAPYLGYMAVGMRSIYPTFDYANFVGPLYADRMDQAETHCFDEWFYLDNLGLNPTPANALDPDWASDPTVQRYFDLSVVGQRKGAGPVLVLQGTGDGLYATYDRFLGDICSTGTAVHGITYRNISHDHVLPQGQADALSWLADRCAGRAAPNDC